MKVTWTRPDQIPAIQRWGVLPLYFAGAGLAGGVLGAAASLPWSNLLWISRRDFIVLWAILGGGLGLGVGISVVLSRRAWVGILAAPLLAFLGTLCGAAIRLSLRGDFALASSLWEEGRRVFEPFWSILILAPALLMSLAHRCVLRLGPSNVWVLLLIPAGVATVWGVALDLCWRPSGSWSDRQLMPSAVLQFGLFGALQSLGMLAAQKFSGRAGEGA